MPGSWSGEHAVQSHNQFEAGTTLTGQTPVTLFIVVGRRDLQLRVVFLALDHSRSPIQHDSRHRIRNQSQPRKPKTMIVSKYSRHLLRCDTQVLD